MGYKQVARDIKQLKIQGAQNIALRAVNSLISCKKYEHIDEAIKLLSAARPTEPCLYNTLLFATHNLNKRNYKKELKQRIKKIELYFKESNKLIAEYGARKIKQGHNVFTHCHSSTVVNVLKRANRAVKFTVHNTETRPFLQGRTTAKELAKAGIKVIHYVDAAARFAIKRSDVVLFGCDAITSEGFIVNKIGSEMFAQIAESYRVPVYICTVSWKYDPATEFGFDEKLEQRFYTEVWRNPPKGVKISNIVFEKIHPSLVTGIISELGIFSVDRFVEEVTRAYPWFL